MPQYDFRKVGLLTLLIVCGLTQAFSQSYSGLHWYYGNNQRGIRFVRPNLQVDTIITANNLGIGGTAVASDPITGAVIFYTNGQIVYDASDQIMPNGTGLLGNSSANQSVVICANSDPLAPNEYLIFTNDGTLRRSVVDMTQNGNGPGFPAPGFGDVTILNNTVGLPTTTRSEGMIIISNTAEDGFWLISHEAGSTNFDVTQIDNTGTITTLATTSIAGGPTNVANLSYNEATSQIAAAPSGPGDVVLLDIDLTTGALSLATTISPPGAASTVYDIERSADGRFVYLSGSFGAVPDQILQVDITDAPPVFRPMITPTMLTSYGLQMGMDSLIYHLYEDATGQFLLGRIDAPDSLGNQALYDPLPLGSINYQGRQFPTFLPDFDPMLQVDFTYSGTCQNAPTFFYPEITPDADSVRWSFGDGTGTSTDLSPNYTYTTPSSSGGVYTVVLTAFLNGTSVADSTTINIQDFDLQIGGVPQQDTLCAEQFGTARAQYTATASGTSAGGAVFQWSSETATGPTTTLDSAGNYYVVATATNGCTVSATIQAVEYGATIQNAFVWYFGRNAGLDFNSTVDQNHPNFPNVTPIDFGDPNIFNGGNQMDTPEGCAIYCDQNGTPLFYSNGSSFYDRLGNEMATNVGGDVGATQSILIQQVPGDATLYYIFLTQETPDDGGDYALRYVIFDLKLRNGLGDIVRDDLGAIAIADLYSSVTERITGNANWLIAHEYGNNNFRAYPLGANGVGSPVISNVGQSHNITPSGIEGQGYMKLSAGGRLAVALSKSANENYVEVFDFNNATGEITFDVALDLSPDTGQVYGVEFSLDERKLFASIKNTTDSKLIYWFIDTTSVVNGVTDPDFIRDVTRQEVAFEAVELGALQMGPNGQIYVAVNTAPFNTQLGVITNTDGTYGTIPNATGGFYAQNPPLFNLSGQNLGANSASQLGLPNFISQFVTQPDNRFSNISNGCSNELLTFSVANPLSPSLETYVWNILDANNLTVAVGTGNSFTFSLTQPGTYTSRLDVFANCSTIDGQPVQSNIPIQSVSQQFVINPLPIVNIVSFQDVTGNCGDANGAIDFEILSTGSFDYTINGPIPTASTNVTGPITPITASALSAGNYNIAVTNAITTCQASVSQAINDPALWTVSATPGLADCNGANGSIEVALSANPDPPTFPVTYTLRDQSSNTVVTSGSEAASPYTISSVNVGTYALEVTESGINGCTITEPDINIVTPPAIQITLPANVVLCDVTEARIPYSTNPVTSVDVTGPGSHTFAGDSIVVTVPGTYTLTTTDQTGTRCNSSQDVVVTFNSSSPIPAQLSSIYSICTLEGDNATIYPGPGFIDVSWFDETGSPITNGGNYIIQGDSLTTSQLGRITVELTNPFGCVTTATMEVLQDCKARVKAPNAFTPNGDATNDSFSIFPFLVAGQDFEIFIFNRWGELVYHSNDLNFAWNGGLAGDAGRPLPGGTYAYKINFRASFEDGKGVQETRGGVTLIR